MGSTNDFVQNPGRVITGGPTSSNNITGSSPYHDKRIQAGLSTQIVIKAQGNDGAWYDVGGIQSFQVTETRNINPIQEVGTDGIIQLHPNGASPITILVTRAVFDYQRLTAAFQRSFHHVMSQRFPFDIVVVDYNPYIFGSKKVNFDQTARGTLPGTSQVRTRFVNCWFNNNSYSYTSDQYLISENASIMAEAVYDMNLSGVVIPSSGVADDVESAHDRTILGSVMTESYAAIKNIGSLS